MSLIPTIDELRPTTPYAVGDSFAEVDEPEVGFAERVCEVVVEVAGQPDAVTYREPMRVCPHWTPAEIAEAHHALTAIDPLAYVAVAVRYRHLGIPVVLVTASIGVTGGGGARRYEERIEGFPELVVECHQRALSTMQGPMRRLLLDVANRKLAETLADLERRAGRQ